MPEGNQKSKINPVSEDAFAGAHIVFWPVLLGRRKIFSHFQETHAHSRNQLVCVKSRQTDVIVVMCDHGDTVSTHLYLIFERVWKRLPVFARLLGRKSSFENLGRLKRFYVKIPANRNIRIHLGQFMHIVICMGFIKRVMKHVEMCRFTASCRERINIIRLHSKLSTFLIE